MAFSNLFKGLFGRSQVTDIAQIPTIHTLPIVPAGSLQPSPPPGGFISAQAMGAQAAQNYWVSNGTQQGQNMKGFATYGNSIKQSSPAFKLEALTRYAELVDAKLEHIYLPDNVTTNHPKVSILKLMQDGEVVKDVGLRYDANNFYVFKED